MYHFNKTVVTVLALFVVLMGCTQKTQFATGDASKSSLEANAVLLFTPPVSQISVGSSATLQATGGTPPYTFSKVSGNGGTLVPSGDGKSVTFNSPAQPQTFVIAVTDSIGGSQTAQVLSQTSNGTSGSLGGLVTNSVNGLVLPGVSIGVHSTSMSGPIVFSTSTDSTGRYLVSSMAAGVYYVDFTLSGFSSILGVPVSIVGGQVTELNESMSSVLNSGQMRIVLTWTGPKSGAVKDVDSYLQMPGFAQPINYLRRTQGNAQLDHDDVDWYGPETVTINAIDPGTYIYYVNNYSDRDLPAALGNSNVHVNVFQGSQQIRSYDIPQGIGISYELFHIVNGSIVEVGAYNDSLFHN